MRRCEKYMSVFDISVERFREQDLESDQASYSILISSLMNNVISSITVSAKSIFNPGLSHTDIAQ